MIDQDTIAADRATALSERLFAALIGGMELATVELGLRLGLYAALRGAGPTTAAELAGRAGIAERYAREWLEQQAAADILEVAGGEGATRRFVLPAATAVVLLEPEHPAAAAADSAMLTALVQAVPAVAAAYRSGGGVPFAAFGAGLRRGIADFNRPMFAADMGTWLATLPDVTGRLQGGGRVLDAGCGMGWSTLALARALPGAVVHGLDSDAASIAEARRHAQEAGLGDRVTFTAGNAAELGGGPYDLVCVFEALHDMGEPVAALRAARAALTPGGAVLVADERTAEAFTAPADEVERMLYAFSVLHCLPATMAESTAVANGTVLRPATLRAWAAEAGFAGVDVLPVDNPFWRFYRLDP